MNLAEQLASLRGQAQEVDKEISNLTRQKRDITAQITRVQRFITQTIARSKNARQIAFKSRTKEAKTRLKAAKTFLKDIGYKWFQDKSSRGYSIKPWPGFRYERKHKISYDQIHKVLEALSQGQFHIYKIRRRGHYTSSYSTTRNSVCRYYFDLGPTSRRKHGKK